jgi:hypothetical protein
MTNHARQGYTWVNCGGVTVIVYRGSPDPWADAAVSARVL